MSKETVSKKTVVKTGKEPIKETVKEKEKEEHQCKDCKFYDLSTQRIFVREHVRKGLKETRAICRAPKDHCKAGGHLVQNISARPCFVRGVYVAPEKKVEKKKPSRKPKPEEKTVVTNGKKVKRLIQATKSLTQGPGYIPKTQEVTAPNGQSAVLIKKNGKTYVRTGQ